MFLLKNATKKLTFLDLSMKVAFAFYLKQFCNASINHNRKKSNIKHKEQGISLVCKKDLTSK